MFRFRFAAGCGHPRRVCALHRVVHLAHADTHDGHPLSRGSASYVISNALSNFEDGVYFVFALQQGVVN